MLVSPQYTFNAGSTLTFRYHMWLNSSDTTAQLSVHVYTQLHAVTQQLFTTSGNHGNSWHKAIVCLPAGTYGLAFIGTIGMTYLSDIGLDDIMYDPTPTSCVTPYVTNMTGWLITSMHSV